MNSSDLNGAGTASEPIAPLYSATSVARKRVILLLLVLTAMAVVFQKASSFKVRLVMAYCFAIPAFAAIWYIVRAARLSPHRAPLLALLAGLFFIIGGIAFDIFATIYHSPDLSRESNPVARFFLDNGYSVDFVYVYGLVLQSTTAGFLVACWWGFLRNYPRCIECAIVHRPASFMAFSKACAGGGKRSWTRHLFAVKHVDPVCRYQNTWMLAPLFLAGALDRWYLGMEWFKWGPSFELAVRAVAFVAFAILAMNVWLYPQYRRWKGSQAVDAPA